MGKDLIYFKSCSQWHAVRQKNLFYPSSGKDRSVPLRLFAPYVTDFWFVDKRYFTAGHDAPADKQRPLLGKSEDYQLEDQAITGPPSWSRFDQDIEPCLLTETYRHRTSGRVIRIHRRRGYGFSALRRESALSRLAIFFYRGDSLGEGGSGNLWLAPDHLADVLARLEDGGLIVTDGSNMGRRTSEYQPLIALRRYTQAYFKEHGIEDQAIGRTLVELAQPFRNQAGKYFECVGFAGFRYGPTMIWRVTNKPPGTLGQ